MEESAGHDLVRKIDIVIALLKDLPPSHLGQHWDEPQVANWLKVFGDLRASLLAGKRPEYVCYVRGLDMCGPCCSELGDAVCEVDVAIGKINKRG